MLLRSLILSLVLVTFLEVRADDGYRLWMRYEKVSDQGILRNYLNTIQGLTIAGSSPTLNVARQELEQGITSLLGKQLTATQNISSGTIVAGTINSSVVQSLGLATKLSSIGVEGFIIYSTTYNGKKIIAIAANSDIGVLYGAFHFLRLLQTQQSLEKLDVTSSPKIKIRVLNHWDNLDRTVERGYAGFSLWNWHELPDYKDQRYIDYARANASIGINGTVLTNVNANALVLTQPYLKKAAALADVFRPYGIKVYLTARFSAPMEIGNLKTADPLDPAVQDWWKKKADEIYLLIPDFGGFLVKANSEGQPGPQNYGRTHADGANMFADALAPYHGIVLWRAFVYSQQSNDRFKQAYEEFKPLDGQFKPNVILQVKNGPIDFQPREPFSPLFGAMPHTPLAMEFQLTQEYLGQATNLVYEAPLFKECLDADTYSKDKGSTVSKVIDGSLENYPVTAMAGVANIGNERNWTGHPFGQANWYAFGKLAWDYTLGSAEIASEWIQQTFTNDPQF